MDIFYIAFYYSSVKKIKRKRPLKNTKTIERNFTMNNKTNLELLPQSQKQDSITASDYYIHFTNESGKPAKHQLNGEEIITTTCPVCGEEHGMGIWEFIQIAGSDFDFYGTMIYCDKCTAERRRNNG